MVARAHRNARRSVPGRRSKAVDLVAQTPPFGSDESVRPELRLVNGRPRHLASRRHVAVALAHDGTPCLPYVEYDRDGFAYDDGQSNVQNQLHAEQVHYAFGAIACVLAGRTPEPLVASDLGVWHEVPEGVPPSRRRRPRRGLVRRRAGEDNDETETPDIRVVAPDVFVALQASRTPPRDSYRVDRGEPLPDFVLEILSIGTARRDFGRKLDLYEALGVREYWLFDLKLRHIPGGLTGLALRDTEYESIAPRPGTLRYPSGVLPVDLLTEAGGLRVFDVAKGRVVEEWAVAIARADGERLRAERAEGAVAQERVRVDEERQRANDLASEVARLKALLARGGRGD